MACRIAKAADHSKSHALRGHGVRLLLQAALVSPEDGPDVGDVFAASGTLATLMAALVAGLGGPTWWRAVSPRSANSDAHADADAKALAKSRADAERATKAKAVAEAKAKADELRAREEEKATTKSFSKEDYSTLVPLKVAVKYLLLHFPSLSNFVLRSANYFNYFNLLFFSDELIIF